MNKDTIKDLTLILMYLTGSRDQDMENGLYVWKGYNFDILNELNEGGLAIGKPCNKSVYLPLEAIKKAKALCAK